MRWLVDANPDFFAGTAVATAAAGYSAAAAGKSSSTVTDPPQG
jgi:hypothetical protein